jgi:hypothetical protein
MKQLMIGLILIFFNFENMSIIEDFKKDLKALLEKYDATILCNINGDTHGLNYEMAVEFLLKDNHWKEYKICDGGGIEKNNI